MDTNKLINNINSDSNEIICVNKDDIWLNYVYDTITEINDVEGKIKGVLKPSPFRGKQNLTYLNLPEVTALDPFSVIADCPKLKSVNLPKLDYAVGGFANCPSLERLDLPNCTTLGDLTGCINLSEINAPLVKDINGKGGGLPLIKELSFPNLERVGEAEFINDINLSKIYIPKVSYVSSNGFNNCENLTDINIDECKTLSNNAFASCIKLSSINLPNLSSFTGNAFYNCINLTTVKLGSTTMVKFHSSVFKNTPITNSTYLGYYGSIYVPMSLIESYRTNPSASHVSERFAPLEDLN